MAQLEQYISVGQTRLRCGYTTGTCAAAASGGAAMYLATGQWPSVMVIDTPAGITVELELLHCTQGEGWASCAVEKDGGDDPDVTHGTLIFAHVTWADTLEIDGGEGVGRITKPGLDQDVGQAAINSVPRKMIAKALQSALDKGKKQGSFKTIISVPDGQRLAQKTFNPRLGIEGGISILGTSGIVRPMSEEALMQSLRIELDMQKAAGAERILLTPGNYGETFCRDTLGLSMERHASCSNYLGQTLDYAALLGFESVLLVGHLGKLCKVAAGNFNTHSKVADGRREVLVTHAALCGGNQDLLQALFQTVTTDQAVALLQQAGLLEPVMARIIQEIHGHLQRRAGTEVRVEVLCFSNQHGLLSQSAGADALLRHHR